MLIFREINQVLVLQTLPLAVAISLQLKNWSWLNIWLYLSLVMLAILLIEPFFIFRTKGKNSASCKWFWAYALLNPFYLLFLKVVTLYAYFRQIIGISNFEVTNKAQAFKTVTF